MGGNAIGSIQWPILENLLVDEQNLADNSYTSRVTAHFVPNFVAMAIRLAILYTAKVMTVLRIV